MLLARAAHLADHRPGAAALGGLLPGAGQHHRRRHHLHGPDGPRAGPHQRGARVRRHQRPGLADRPQLALLSVALVDVWKGVGLATVIYIAGHRLDPARLLRGRRGRRRQRRRSGSGTSSCRWPGRRRHRDHPVADRRPAVVRPDLGDDPGRARVHLRRHRLGDLQAVPGRVLRAVDRGQRGPVPRSSPRSSCRCSGPDRQGGRLDEHQAGTSWPRACSASRDLFGGRSSSFPFAFILFTAFKTRQQAASSSSRCPAELPCSRTSATRSRPATTCWSSPSSTARS